jgi:RNAse (barnase) inhibitor barstar
MSTFTDDPSEWTRLDWQLLQNSPVTLYFRPDVLEADVGWFEAAGYRVISVRVAAHFSPSALLDKLAELLVFPEHFGRNLDAFNDCLGDVDVPQVGGLLLVLSDYGSFAASFQREAQAILDICADQSRRFLLTGRRFLVLVQSSEPTIKFEPVGASPVIWNPKEFLNSTRGL